jgi:hypothetical protein
MTWSSKLIYKNSKVSYGEPIVQCEVSVIMGWGPKEGFASLKPFQFGFAVRRSSYFQTGFAGADAELAHFVTGYGTTYGVRHAMIIQPLQQLHINGGAEATLCSLYPVAGTKAGLGW